MQVVQSCFSLFATPSPHALLINRWRRAAIQFKPSLPQKAFAVGPNSVSFCISNNIDERACGKLALALSYRTSATPNNLDERACGEFVFAPFI